jgi:hypothetical protein
MGLFSFLSPSGPSKEIQERLQRGGITMAGGRRGDTMGSFITVHVREFRASRLYWLRKFPNDPRLQNELAFLGDTLDFSKLAACYVQADLIRDTFKLMPDINIVRCAASLEIEGDRGKLETTQMYLFSFTRAQNLKVNWNNFDYRFWEVAPDWEQSVVFTQGVRQQRLAAQQQDRS